MLRSFLLLSGVTFACAIPLLDQMPARAAAACEEARGESVLERFLSRGEEPLRQYRAWRRLYGRNEKFNREAWMEVWTERDENARLRYEIIDEGGSDYVRNRVLKRVLESEEESTFRDDQAAALSAANYVFRPSGACSDGLLKLEIRPRRQEVQLVKGTLFVTPYDAELVRLEGQPAKNPSFWTRRVEIVRQYDRLAGVRVLRRVEWQSQVKVAGPSSFVMVYEYETVNGRRVATLSDLEWQIERHRQRGGISADDE